MSTTTTISCYRAQYRLRYLEVVRPVDINVCIHVCTWFVVSMCFLSAFIIFQMKNFVVVEFVSEKAVEVVHKSWIVSFDKVGDLASV